MNKNAESRKFFGLNMKSAQLIRVFGDFFSMYDLFIYFLFTEIKAYI